MVLYYHNNKNQVIYMKCIYDNDLHIHSMLSSCSNDEKQTTERILSYAKENNLKTICITDHFWDENVTGASDWYKPQNFAHISSSLPLPEENGIRFLFGCEGDMDKYLTLGISKECFDKFDFVVIPTTHLHMTGFTYEETDNTPERKAELWLKRLDALLNMDLPFHKIGIAHLACNLIFSGSREKYIETLNLLPEDELKKLFTKAAKLGCGIELNYSDMSFGDEEADDVLRMFRIAKDCGCKFYFGSDAHHPSGFEKTKVVFERAIDMLGLTEDDKFII